MDSVVWGGIRYDIYRRHSKRDSPFQRTGFEYPPCYYSTPPEKSIYELK